MLSVVPARRAPEPAADAMGGLVRETFRAMLDCVEPHFNEDELALSQWLTLKLVDIGKITCIGHITRELGISGGASTRLGHFWEEQLSIFTPQERRTRLLLMTRLRHSLVRGIPAT